MDTSIYDDPKVKELLKKIAELTALMDEFQKKIDPLHAAQQALTQETTDLDEEYQRKRLELNKRRASLNDERHNIDRELARLAEQQKSMKRDVDSMLDELKAAGEMEALHSKWAGIINELPWRDMIRPFQLIGAKRIAHKKKFLLADEMGLGKTFQVEAALELTDPEFFNEDEKSDSAVLWLTKKTLMQTTLEEIRKWNPGRIVVPLLGGKAKRGRGYSQLSPEQRSFMVEAGFNSGAIVVANYEALQSTPKILELPWRRIVTDEAHAYKSHTSNRFKNVKQLAPKAEMFVALTGTPIQNRPDELWSILHMLDPKRWAKKWVFENDYCYSSGGQFGGSNSFRPGAYDRLVKDIKDFTLRRRKDEVDIELPDLTREQRFVELGDAQRQVYEQVRTAFATFLEDDSTPLTTQNTLAWLTRLRQIALWPQSVQIPMLDNPEKNLTLSCDEGAKIDEALEVASELLENGQKVVIFSTFNEPLRETKRRIEKLNSDYNVELMVGGMNPGVVSDIVTKFQNEDEPHVLCGNIKMMGEGLNLYRASHVIFLDLWWNPATNEQAEARLHRIGQKSAVEVHIIQAEDTVDAFIRTKLEEKSEMFNQIFERAELRKALDEGLI